MPPSIELNAKNLSGSGLGMKLSMRGRRMASPRENCRRPFSSASIADEAATALSWSSLLRKIAICTLLLCLALRKMCRSIRLWRRPASSRCPWTIALHRDVLGLFVRVGRDRRDDVDRNEQRDHARQIARIRNQQARRDHREEAGAEHVADLLAERDATETHPRV